MGAAGAGPARAPMASGRSSLYLPVKRSLYRWLTAAIFFLQSSLRHGIRRTVTRKDPHPTCISGPNLPAPRSTAQSRDCAAEGKPVEMGVRELSSLRSCCEDERCGSGFRQAAGLWRTAVNCGFNHIATKSRRCHLGLIALGKRHSAACAAADRESVRPSNNSVVVSTLVICEAKKYGPIGPDHPLRDRSRFLTCCDALAPSRAGLKT